MKSQVLERLREDHRNAARLLSMLDAETDRFARAEPADAELLQDIMMYMTRYSDRVHHPLEDLLFEALSRRSAEARPLVDAAGAEHKALAERGRKFHEALSSIVDGAMVDRAELVEAGVSYSSLLREHMQRENERLFPLASDVLPDDEWADVAARFEAQKDPLFGPVTEADFATLLANTERHAQHSGH